MVPNCELERKCKSIKTPCAIIKMTQTNGKTVLGHNDLSKRRNISNTVFTGLNKHAGFA